MLSCPNSLLHFNTIYALEGISCIESVSCVTAHVVPTLGKEHIGSLKLAMVGAFPLWKIANTLNPSLVYCFVDCLDLTKS